MNPFKPGDRVKCYDSYIIQHKFNPVAIVCSSFQNNLTCNFTSLLPNSNSLKVTQPIVVNYKTCRKLKPKKKKLMIKLEDL